MEPETNAVMEKLADLIENADRYYVQVGQRTMLLSDPELPIPKAVAFVRDRLKELTLDAIRAYRRDARQHGGEDG